VSLDAIRRGRPRTSIGETGKVSEPKTLKNGASQVSARVRLPNGELVRVTGAGRTPTEAKAVLKSNVKHLLATWDAVQLSPNMLVRDLGRSWLAEFDGSDRSTQTKSRYASTLAGVIDREMGSKTVREVTNASLRKFVKALSKEHLAEARTARVVLRAVFAHGAENAICQASVFNFDGLELAVPKKPARALTAVELIELRRLIEADRVRQAAGKGPNRTKMHDDLADVLSLIFATSLRISEVLAIKRERIDFETGTLHVKEKIEYALGKGGYRVGPVKTTSTERYIELPDWALDILRTRLESALPDGFAFTTRKKKALSQNNVRRTLRQALAGTELGEWFTPHAARKTVASAVFAELGAEVAAAVLGHGDGGKLILSTYGERKTLAPNVTHITDRFAPEVRTGT